MSEFIHISSIAELYGFLNTDKPSHPLITIIRKWPKSDRKLDQIKFTSDLYFISLKRDVKGSFKYGRNSYDYQEGNMVFIKPGQVATFSPSDEETESNGWTILFHPDLIRKCELGKNIHLNELVKRFDSVFLGLGLGAVNNLRVSGDDLENVSDAVQFISGLRQADDLTSLRVGREVLVIGGGMTAVDAAVQSKLLGAETVTIAYRRSKDKMGASTYEQELATSNGVVIRENLKPKTIIGNGKVSSVEFERTKQTSEGLTSTGEAIMITADQVFVAIGQALSVNEERLEFAGNKINVSGSGRTSCNGVWAGGDCVSGGEDLTVTAVAQGRDAAEDINLSLMG